MTPDQEVRKKQLEQARDALLLAIDCQPNSRTAELSRAAVLIAVECEIEEMEMQYRMKSLQNRMTERPLKRFPLVGVGAPTLNDPELMFYQRNRPV